MEKENVNDKATQLREYLMSDQYKEKLAKPYTVRKSPEKKPIVIRPFDKDERQASIIREKKNGRKK